MKVLITGATGLVGKHLVSELLASGYGVCFLTTQKSKLKALPNCKGFLWNPKQHTIDKKCLIGVTTIIHLAGANIGKRWTAFYKKEIINSRVQSTKLLYQLLSKTKHQVKHIVAASAIGIYAHSYVENYTEQSTTLSTSFLGDVVQKWEQEQLKFMALNIKVAVIRTGIVLDKKEGALPKMMQPIKMRVGAALCSGKQYMSWIHHTDLARLYIFVAKNKTEGIVNAVAPEVLTNTSFTQFLATQMHRKIYLPNIPKWMLKLLLGEMYLLLCESQKVSSKKIETLGFVFQYPRLTIALANIFND